MEAFFVVVLVAAVLVVGGVALVALRRLKHHVDPADPQER